MLLEGLELGLQDLTGSDAGGGRVMPSLGGGPLSLTCLWRWSLAPHRT